MFLRLQGVGAFHIYFCIASTAYLKNYCKKGFSFFLFCEEYLIVYSFWVHTKAKTTFRNKCLKNNKLIIFNLQHS